MHFRLHAISPRRRPPSSPAWHRKQRRFRSRARLRIRLARAQGLQPSQRDIRRLADHHAKPAYREDRSHMGKRGQWPQDWSEWSEPWYGQHPSRGGQGRQHGKGKDKGKDQPWRSKEDVKGPVFPTFDAMPVNTPAGKGPVERRQPTTTRGSSSSTVDLVKGAQKLVNNLRKAETKVRKTEEELCHVAEQWSVFQEGLKKAFIKERGKYLEARRRRSTTSRTRSPGTRPRPLWSTRPLPWRRNRHGTPCCKREQKTTIWA